MSTIMYVMANESRDNIHVGTTQALKKALEFYTKIPSMSYPVKKLNMLVYLEEFTNKNAAIERFEQVTRFNKAQKTELIESVNPDWIDMIPGETFEMN